MGGRSVEQGGWGRGWGGLQCDPHGGTEELLVSEHCLADCPRRLPVFFLPRSTLSEPSRGRSAEPGHPPIPPPSPPVRPPPPGHTHIHAVQMAILTAQKTAPLCHPLPPGAFAIFFKQPLHSGWVAAVCTVLAGAVLTQTLCKGAFQSGFDAFQCARWG